MRKLLGARMTLTGVDDLDSEESHFYVEAIGKLQAAEVPFLVGGAYSLQAHTGIIRRTKDFDIFVAKQDVPRALQVFAAAGYLTEIAFPHWLGKAFSGDAFIDVIFSSGNGVCPVDADWFEHAVDGRVLGLNLKICPAEETIWQKAFILERDRCDVADVAHLIRHRGAGLDWQRLLRRFGEHWRVLFAQIVLFDFIYPDHRSAVPDAVRQDLNNRFAQASTTANTGAKVCYGTLLSATQYLRDIDLEHYHDGRLAPLGNLQRDDIAIWTANFMKPK